MPTPSPAPAPAKIFISYKRNVEPDQTLAARVFEALQQQGHAVFIDRTMTVGQQWAREIETRRTRAALQDAATAAGIKARIVPHQFRHTYASEMLRAGVSLPAVVKLLGHKSPRMTLQYLEITQQDLQREYHLARTQPRHLAPAPRAVSSASPPSADLLSLLDSLRTTQYVLEMFRRSVAETSRRRLLDRLANRLVKIVTEAKKLNTPEK
jgi:hypothetical protein